MNLDLESETFCEDIAEILIPNLKNLVFNKMNIEEKLLEIYNKIEDLSDRLDDLYYKQEEEMGIMRRLFKLIW